MVKNNKMFHRVLSWMSVFSLVVTVGAGGLSANASEECSVSYDFAQERAGYAQGTITFYADTQGTYKLYWANAQGILEGYYPIDTLEMKSNQSSKSVQMGEHTAIPAGATKIIAVSDTGDTPIAVYDIPQNKQLSAVSGEKLYTFSAYSDVHIDKGSGWYVNADQHWKEGLKYAVDRESDYIVISGDVVTNDSGPDKEWIAYEKLLSQSDFVNPVWESDGNHDLRQDVESGIKSFIKHTGTDSVPGSNKSYFFKVEEKTGDVFIFMSLELNKNPNNAAEFSNEQLAWAESLMQEYATRGVNVFLIQHSPIKKFGAGDRMSDPYYKGLLNTSYEANARFKEMIQSYPNVVWLSGHTHEDFDMDYNYSNENNTACHMIHIPALAGSTKAKDPQPTDPDEDKLERKKGKGFNSQGYYTEVYENEIVFYGVNLSDQLVYPKYSYIMESGRTSESVLPAQPAQPSLTGETLDLSPQLSVTVSILSKYYQYASYDQYQALKKLYYQYKDQPIADRAVLTQFEEKIDALSEHTGEISVYAVGDTYYFENNKSWSKVYGYAWDGSHKNAEWPGVKLSKVGKNNGHDVYAIKFDSAGQYHNLIFTDGSSQTVNIALYDYGGNCFKLGSTTDGKYNVSNYVIDLSGGEVIPPDSEQHKYALLYYVSGEHDWSDTNTLFTRNDDGTYTYTFQSNGSQNMSFSLYDKTDKVYQSMAESASLVYEDGKTKEYTLSQQSSRGKSITVKGLSATSVLHITYSPATNTVSVLCGNEQQALASNAVLSAEQIHLGESVTVQCAAEGGAGGYTYAVQYKKTTDTKWTYAQNYSTNATVTVTPAKATTYDICVTVKDEKADTAQQCFTINVGRAVLTNNSTISTTTVPLGENVTVNAAASGGAGEYQYAVQYKKATDTKWTYAQNYSTNAVIAVTPMKKTNYEICVKAKDKNGSIEEKVFAITVTDALLKNTSTVSAEEIAQGESVTVNCSATGGKAPYQYMVQYKKETDTKYTNVQAYSTNSTVSFKPMKKVNYIVLVKAKDSKGTVSSTSFTIKVR